MLYEPTRAREPNLSCARFLSIFCFLVSISILRPNLLHAEQIPVRHLEGVTFGFLVLQLDASTGQLTVRYSDGGKQKQMTKHLDLPDDVANGLLLTLIKNIDPRGACRNGFDGRCLLQTSCRRARHHSAR
jgi:hypothetical protein